MDSKDWKIFNYLRENSRAFIKEIAKQLNIPHSTVYERMKRMKNEGIIKKFTILPDYKKLGLDVCAYLLINFDPRSLRTQEEVAREIAQIDRVYGVEIITGEWDILVKVRTENMDILKDVIVRKIREIKGVEKTETLVVFESIKETC